MFYEPRLQNPGGGWIEVICGSMFSGKTEELIRRVNRAAIAGQSVKIFKPSIDDRYAADYIVSHNQSKVESKPIDHIREMRKLLEGATCDVIAIDEAQFFGEELLQEVQRLADLGYRVIISGLDMDFERKGFGIMPKLMAIAEYVTKLQAICMKCGNTGAYSFRVATESDQVLLGAGEAYEARCRSCYIKGEGQKAKQDTKTNMAK